MDVAISIDFNDNTFRSRYGTKNAHGQGQERIIMIV